MNDKKFVKDKRYYQILACKDIIEAIQKGEYMDASIQIRNNLNDNSYNWYKPIENIIDNQITNLFYDIETNFKKNLTVDFFKRMIDEIKFDIENGY